MLKALNGSVVNDVSSVNDLTVFMVSNHNFMQLYLTLLPDFHYLIYICKCHASRLIYAIPDYYTIT